MTERYYTLPSDLAGRRFQRTFVLSCRLKAQFAFFFELCIVFRVQSTKVIERKLTSETEWLDSSNHLEKTGDSIGRRGASRTVQSKRPYFSTWP